MAVSYATPQSLPEHVPPSLVRDFPLVLGESTFEDPFARMIPALHNGPPVFYGPRAYLGIGPAWVFLRSKDVQAIYADTENFSSKDFAPFSKLIGDTWSEVPVEIDPPMHGLYRAFMNPLFAPRKMAEMDGRVRQFARQYIDVFKARGRCEFMGDFAFRFPIAVFLELMGLPLDNVDQFLYWEHGLLHEPDMAKVAQTTRAVKKYLWEVIEERRKNPTDDLVSVGVKARIEGRALTDDELFGFCFNLFIGGLDTVSTNIALQFRHLATHLHHQKALRDEPKKIPTAVEELLRAYAAVTTARTCIKPVEISGVKIMPGDKVLLSTTLANRDPEAFDSPNEVKLDRNPRHITFGSGIHRCVGAPLARRELIIAMEEFLAAIPEFTIEPGAKIETTTGPMIEPGTLPLVWKV